MPRLHKNRSAPMSGHITIRERFSRMWSHVKTSSCMRATQACTAPRTRSRGGHVHGLRRPPPSAHLPDNAILQQAQAVIGLPDEQGQVAGQGELDLQALFADEDLLALIAEGPEGLAPVAAAENAPNHIAELFAGFAPQPALVLQDPLPPVQDAGAILHFPGDPGPSDDPGELEEFALSDAGALEQRAWAPVSPAFPSTYNGTQGMPFVTVPDHASPDVRNRRAGDRAQPTHPFISCDPPPALHFCPPRLPAQFHEPAPVDPDAILQQAQAVIGLHDEQGQVAGQGELDLQAVFAHEDLLPLIAEGPAGLAPPGAAAENAPDHIGNLFVEFAPPPPAQAAGEMLNLPAFLYGTGNNGLEGMPHGAMPGHVQQDEPAEPCDDLGELEGFSS
eukprot:jgi/Ulvmu1/7641/UM038_0069.1